MILLVDEEDAEKGISTDTYHKATFVAVYRPQNRVWNVKKNRYGPNGIMDESEFERAVSEAMTAWAARKVKNEDSNVKASAGEISNAISSFADSSAAKPETEEPEAYNDINASFFGAPTF